MSTDNQILPDYHPGCTHRYQEKMDHEALMRKLNLVNDDLVKLAKTVTDLAQKYAEYTDVTALINELQTDVTNITSNLNALQQQVQQDIATSQRAMQDEINLVKMDVNKNAQGIATLDQMFVDMGFDPSSGEMFKPITEDEITEICAERFNDDDPQESE